MLTCTKMHQFIHAVIDTHYVESVQVRSDFWSVFSRIRTEYGPEITLYLDTFHAGTETLSKLAFFYYNKNLCQLNMKFQPGNYMFKVNNKNNWTRCEVSSKFNNKDIRTMPLAYQIFISLQMRALQKLWKILFISSKKLSSFSRYSNFCISIFPSFSACQPLL